MARLMLQVQSGSHQLVEKGPLSLSIPGRQSDSTVLAKVSCLIVRACERSAEWCAFERYTITLAHPLDAVATPSAQCTGWSNQLATREDKPHLEERRVCICIRYRGRYCLLFSSSFDRYSLVLI